MDILIIGGTGFISSRLVDYLVLDGHRVTTLTRGRTRSPARPRVERLYGDRRDSQVLRQAAAAGPYDAVFDMVAYEAEESARAVEAFRGRAGRFIHCSTVSVYMVSDEVECPITEGQDRRPLMPHWPRNPFGMDYGIGKRGCEEVLWAAHHETDLPVTVLRPTFVSGPGDPTARDYFWIERIRDGQPLLVPGNGEHPFQQVFVDDAARAFAAVLDHPESAGRAYNVASEEVFTLNDYLLALGRLLGHRPELVHIDQKTFDALPISSHPHGDVFPFNTRRPAVFSLARIKQDLGFTSTPFESWMSDTIDWYDSLPGITSRGYDRRKDELALAERAV